MLIRKPSAAPISHCEEMRITSREVQFTHSAASDSATPWAAACLSITNSRSLLKLMSIVLVMPFNHLFHSLPAFNLSQHQGLFQWVDSLHQVAQVLEFQLQHHYLQWIIQDWFPLEWTGWISLQSWEGCKMHTQSTETEPELYLSVSCGGSGLLQGQGLLGAADLTMA